MITRGEGDDRILVDREGRGSCCQVGGPHLSDALPPLPGLWCNRYLTRDAVSPSLHLAPSPFTRKADSL